MFSRIEALFCSYFELCDCLKLVSERNLYHVCIIIQRGGIGRAQAANVVCKVCGYVRNFSAVVNETRDSTIDYSVVSFPLQVIHAQLFSSVYTIHD